MRVLNDHLGELFLTDHAEERWLERGDGALLQDSIKIAVPFGAQLGDDILLRNEDVVFATTKSGANRVVTTVLTYDFAVANIQASMGARSAKPEIDVKQLPAPMPEPAIYDAPRPKKKRGQDNSISGKRMLQLFEMSDADFAVARASITNPLLSQITNRIAGLRRDIRTMRRHDAHEQLDRKAIRTVLTSMFDDAQMTEFWAKVSEERKRLAEATNSPATPTKGVSTMTEPSTASEPPPTETAPAPAPDQQTEPVNQGQ